MSWTSDRVRVIISFQVVAGRMSPQNEPSIDEGNELRDPLSQSSYQNDVGTVSPARPSMYYGDIDHSSSENEDEALLEKTVPSTPGMIERGGLDTGASRVRPLHVSSGVR